MSDIDERPTPPILAPAPTADALEPAEPRPVPAADTGAGDGVLAGLVALVAGGEAGIGRAVAVALAEAGADVAIAYCEAHEAARATMVLIQEAGREALAVAGDVRLGAFCTDVVAETVRRFGRLDILVNAAVPTGPASVGPGSPGATPLDDEATALALDTTLRGAMQLARAALPHLPEGGAAGGRIVNTAAGGADVAAEAAAAGVCGFTRALARSVGGRGIRVNAVAGTAPLAATAAAAYVYLASAQSGAMTGEILHPAPGDD